MAMIQAFFTKSYIQSMAGDSLFNTSVNVSVPDFDIYEHDFSKVIADDRKTDLSLKKIAEAARSDQRVFTSLAHSVVTCAISLLLYWNSQSTVILIIMGCVTVINSLLSFGLFINFGPLARQFCFIGYRPLYLQPLSMNPYPLYQPLQSTNAWDHALFLLAELNLICLLYFGSRYLTISGRQTRVVIEVTCPHTCILLPVFHLPLCPSFYLAMFPSRIASIRDEGHLRPRLHVLSPGFVMRSILDQKSVSIQRFVLDGIYASYFDLTVVFICIFITKAFHSPYQHKRKNHPPLMFSSVYSSI